MSARAERVHLAEAIVSALRGQSVYVEPTDYTDSVLVDGSVDFEDAADAILAAGYRKPRTITTAEELEKLPYGSAVQTSDESDTVVLKDRGAFFRNQSGCELPATDLWRYGTRPFTVLYSPEASR